MPVSASRALNVGRNQGSGENEFSGVFASNRDKNGMMSFDAGSQSRPQTTTVLVNDKNDWPVGYSSQSAMGQHNSESVKPTGTAGTTVYGGIEVTPLPNDDQDQSFQQFCQ